MKSKIISFRTDSKLVDLLNHASSLSGASIPEIVRRGALEYSEKLINTFCITKVNNKNKSKEKQAEAA